MTRSLRSWKIRSITALGLALSGLLIAGCAEQLSAPTATPTGDQAPVTLRNLQVTTADGHRAVFLRLSRVPTLVRHSSSRKPAQITIQASGPPGDGDLSPRTIPQADPQISTISVSRQEGTLRVTLDFQGDDPPSYSVHQMADWIMVRLGAPES